MRKFVSKTERVYLYSVACFTSLLCLANLLYKGIHPIHYPAPYGIYDLARPSFLPLFQLVLIPLPLLLLRPGRFILPAILNLVALVPAYFEFGGAYSALLANFESLNGYNSLRILLLIANPFEYATFALANLLFVWICSIVIRSFTATDVT
jgi:hypothetical protein